jgi:uncharacterized protein (TIGR02246 family)
MNPLRFRRLSPLLLLALSTACATAPPPGSTSAAADQDIIDQLQTSAQAWNDGDLEGFLHPYSQGEEATFVGQEVVHGYAAIRDFYRGSWWRGGRPTVRLAYRDIVVRRTGPASALVVGHWVVSDPATGQESRHGIFSLTWMRTSDGWRIVHDHSS